MRFWFILRSLCIGSVLPQLVIFTPAGAASTTLVCFIGFLIIGTKLNRKLLYGAKPWGSIDEKRSSQINQIYKVAVTGSLVCIAIFVESLIAMVISCFNNDKCGLCNGIS
ncbi:hypothetical protein M0813_23761 [Anaeramoeba flamelloides]|uniref:Uncharacterized protein n=1 Tax=Anaeramoeba flamelloides TaxID=1746091 RepID=A0ABQ8YAR9_9EUKA|nr:hypothetical protein M0813_23761 [Anaeramoeba flamelloides]